MIKAIFFDIDGTLLSHQTKKVSQDTRNALKQLQKQNIKVILATGRHIREIEDLDICSVEVDGYILNNGNICLDENKKLIYDCPIDKEDMDYISTIFTNKEVPLMFVSQEKIYMNIDNDFVKKVQADISSPVPLVTPYLGEPIYQISAYIGKISGEEAFPKLKNCKFTRWHEDAIDIIPQQGGKVAGIKAYLKKLNITPEQTMAFGDGENDIDMLKFVGIGVAMGNSDSFVKESADFITKDIDENGISFALKHFGLIGDEYV